MDLPFMMVKRRKQFFSSSEASDFWWRLRTDFCTHPDSVSYETLNPTYVSWKKRAKRQRFLGNVWGGGGGWKVDSIARSSDWCASSLKSTACFLVESLNPTYHERKGQTSKGFWGMLEEEGGKWIQLLGRRSERDHLRAANGFTEMTPILDA